MSMLLLTVTALLGSIQAQSCNAPSPSGKIKPSVAAGYSLQVVATGLAGPRGLKFDNQGNLLVVESHAGVVSAHVLNQTNDCVTVSSSNNVTTDLGLNHGIELSPDGKTLYASNPADVYAWSYDGTSRSAQNQATLVTNMTTNDHTTRTLLLSHQVPGLLIVTRGSTSNIDLAAATFSSGHSQIKAFNLKNQTNTIYDFDSDGLLLGWGLRNDVGVDEHPTTGGIYSVENSADQISRMGVDVHENNPAEEMNFFGYLNGTSYSEQGANFGYPWCFSAWNVSELPDNGNITVGKQFAIDASSDTNNQNKTDEYCFEQAAPRLVFQAHMAPLDIKFNDTGSQAWVTFHGSWDRTVPVGYKLSLIQFQNGEPVDASTSTSAATDIVTNADITQCPNNCFRPAGLAIDSQGRIFMSSDSSGEIYLVTRTNSANGTTTAGGTSSTATSVASSHIITLELKLGIVFTILVSLFS